MSDYEDEAECEDIAFNILSREFDGNPLMKWASNMKYDDHIISMLAHLVYNGRLK